MHGGLGPVMRAWRALAPGFLAPPSAVATIAIPVSQMGKLSSSEIQRATCERGWVIE